MRWIQRAGGGVAIVRGVHVWPSHSQRSPNTTLPGARPPKSTITPRASSNTMNESARTDGPATTRWVHRVPFHSHVSPRNAPLKPPKLTVTPRMLSKAHALSHRAEGPSVERRSQTEPSHSQVWRKTLAKVNVLAPPTRTTRPRLESYANPNSPRGDGPATCRGSHAKHSSARACSGAKTRANVTRVWAEFMW